MSGIYVDIINESTVASDSQLQSIVAALQKQVNGEFFLAWGIDAALTFIPKGGTPDPTHWQLGIFDNSDQAGALGYHDITDQGLPLGKVFAQTDIQYGSSLSVTISHELLEMLGDPDINLTVYVQSSDTAGTLYAYETCDAVEADSLGYEIDGVLVSDFVYPAWFESFRQQGPFDQRQKCTAPFQLLAGGYISVYQFPNTAGWTQITARVAKKESELVPVGGSGRVAHEYRNRPRLGSRREKRRTPRDRWIRSAVRLQRG